MLKVSAKSVSAPGRASISFRRHQLHSVQGVLVEQGRVPALDFGADQKLILVEDHGDDGGAFDEALLGLLEEFVALGLIDLAGGGAESDAGPRMKGLRVAIQQDCGAPREGATVDLLAQRYSVFVDAAD